MTDTAQMSALVATAPELLLAVGAMALLMLGAFRGERVANVADGIAIAFLVAAALIVARLPDGKPAALGGSFRSGAAYARRVPGRAGRQRRRRHRDCVSRRGGADRGASARRQARGARRQFQIRSCLCSARSGASGSPTSPTASRLRFSSRRR